MNEADLAALRGLLTVYATGANADPDTATQSAGGVDYVVLAGSADKGARTRLHAAVRTHFEGFESDTVDVAGEGGLKAVRVRRSGRKRPSRVDGGGSGKRAKFDPRDNNKPQWPAGRGKWLTFTLAKEGKDTMEAVNVLSKFLRRKPATFSYAGTKDRRAVSTRAGPPSHSRLARRFIPQARFRTAALHRRSATLGQSHERDSVALPVTRRWDRAPGELPARYGAPGTS